MIPVFQRPPEGVLPADWRSLSKPRSAVCAHGCREHRRLGPCGHEDFETLCSCCRKPCWHRPSWQPQSSAPRGQCLRSDMPGPSRLAPTLRTHSLGMQPTASPLLIANGESSTLQISATQALAGQPYGCCSSVSLWHCTNETLSEVDAVIMRHWLTDLAVPSSPSNWVDWMRDFSH